MKQSKEQSMRAVGSPVACLAVLAFAAAAGAVDMPVVPVGNPGNPGAYPTGPKWGDVSYSYDIGKYEVTAGQYTEFLNAVARTDTYGLYNVNMDTAVDAYGCNILRSGTPCNYSYTIAPDWANRPVNYVSWGDAARFANWMHNGQPATGMQDATTTEDGSYLLNGMMDDFSLGSVKRKAAATWALPTQHEWVKAAYHKNDGVSGNYWTYPTASDTSPSNALDVAGGNSATFRTAPDSTTLGTPYWRTEGGDHTGSPSPYGTFDQGGNISEWSDTSFFSPVGFVRLRFGGSFDEYASWMWVSTTPNGGFASLEAASIGFRLALVPEPGCVLLLMCGVGAWAVRSRGGRRGEE